MSWATLEGGLSRSGRSMGLALVAVRSWCARRQSETLPAEVARAEVRRLGVSAKRAAALVAALVSSGFMSKAGDGYSCPVLWAPGPRDAGEGFVYFVQSGAAGLIKIGFASNPLDRLSTLQTGSAEELVLLATTPGTLESEKALHVQFAAARVRGEWFDRAPELMALIATLREAPLCKGPGLLIRRAGVVILGCCSFGRKRG